MSEKSKRGRPRKYETSAERKKAYRERKKAERIKLEKRVIELEKKLGIYNQEIPDNIKKDPILSLTIEDIKNLNDETLLNYGKKINDKYSEELNLNNPIKSLVNDIIETSEVNNKEIISKQIIALKVSESLHAFEQTIQELTILFLIRKELYDRLEDESIKIELDILEERIKELEVKALDKDKIKPINLK